MLAKGMWNQISLLRRKYLVVYPSQNSNQMDEIFFYFLQFDIIDVIIMAYDFNLKNDSIILYTWDPHHSLNNCGSTLKYAKKNTCKTIQAFPNTKFVRTFNYCNLTYYHKTKWEWDKNQNELGWVNQFVIHTIGKLLKVNIQRQMQIKVKNNLPGLLIRLCILEYSEHPDFSTTLPMVRSPYVFLVPLPKRMNSFEVFQIIFKAAVWGMVCITFLVTTITWWIISKCDRPTNFSAVILDVYSVTVFGCVNRLSSYLPFRIIFITYVLYAIHVQTAFTSNLVKILTTPQYHPCMNTVEDIADSNVRIIIFEKQAKLFTREDGDDTIYGKIKKKFFNHGFYTHQNCMRNKSVLDEYVVFATLDLFYVYVQIAQIKVQVVMDTSLIGAQHRVLTTKAGSYLYPSVKNVVTALTESGVIQREQNKFQKHIKEKIGNLYDNQMDEPNEEPIVLSMEHVFPVFVFWGVGLIIATLMISTNATVHARKSLDSGKLDFSNHD
ncbi:hypothetical protein FQA39_LY02749 [Lamprigera yunnana]|nr:hypothetical protein FQA39_LY02749 [Lamprigera yunnana]